MKKVSVILPNYNYAQYFSQRIDGILAQTYPVSEIIVLDDGSTDNSREVITEKLASVQKSYPRLKIKTAFSSRNSGNVFQQWQKGIELASEQYLWICELDDGCAANFLEAAMAGFTKNPRTILSYTNSKFISDQNRRDLKSELRQIKNFFRENRPKTAYIRNGREELEKVLLYYNTVPNISAVVFKKAPTVDFTKVLKQASEFKLAGDWYFYSEILLRGDIAYSPKKLNYHRIHSQSVTAKVDLSERYREVVKVQNHIASNLSLPEDIKQRLARCQQVLAKKWGII